MKGKQQDRHLQAPGEANLDKHINFLATERGEHDSEGDANNKTETKNSRKNYRRITKNWRQKQQDRHLQSPTEANRDKHINFAALEEGDDDPSKEGNTDTTESEDDEPNPVYTNSDAAQQQIERVSNPQLKGRKDNPLSDVYTTDESTQQTKEEHEHDASMNPNSNNKIGVTDFPETEIDKDVSSQQGQHAERNP